MFHVARVNGMGWLLCLTLTLINHSLGKEPPESRAMNLLRRNPNYRLLFSASGISNLGDGISALAFPWLATLITRDATMIALVAAATRLPWLLFALPAGVITDQFDRRQLIVMADILRTLITFGVITLVLSAPPLPLSDTASNAGPLITALCAAAFLLGSAEVIRDNAAQTVLPSIVEKPDLEKANGQMWSVEQIMGQFIGPPLAGFLIALTVPLPFVVIGVTFAIAAWLLWRVTLLPQPKITLPKGFFAQLREGAVWMKDHPLILRLAIILGGLNFLTMMSATILVLLSQEIMGLNAAGHGILLTAGALGAVAGGMIGPHIAARFGPQRTVLGAFCVFPIPFIILAMTANPYIAGVALFAEMCAGMTWNVVTVSLRQRLIPDALLGRVNSIYRFFGWGTIPLGAIFAGALVSIFETPLGRETALRTPYIFAAIACTMLLIYCFAKLRFPRE
jgi:MFS family permease